MEFWLDEVPKNPSLDPAKMGEITSHTKKTWLLDAIYLLAIYIYTYTYIHTYILTYLHTYIHTYIHIYIYSSIVHKLSPYHAMITLKYIKDICEHETNTELKMTTNPY